jgi:hypothetical protein
MTRSERRIPTQANETLKIMTTKKINLAAMVAAAIGIAMICGCGNGHKQSQKSRQPQTIVRTEWNDTSTHLSPFTKVRYEGEKVMVTYNGAEYELTALNGLPVSEILKYCHEQYGERWQKRFAEDLVPVMNDMGHPLNPDHTVSLTLVNVASGQSTDIAGAAMTGENRSAVLEAERQAEP